MGVGLVDSKYSLYRELNRKLNWIFTDRAAETSIYLQALQNKEEKQIIMQLMIRTDLSCLKLILQATRRSFAIHFTVRHIVPTPTLLF